MKEDEENLIILYSNISTLTEEKMLEIGDLVKNNGVDIVGLTEINRNVNVECCKHTRKRIMDTSSKFVKCFANNVRVDSKVPWGE